MLSHHTLCVSFRVRDPTWQIATAVLHTALQLGVVSASWLCFKVLLRHASTDHAGYNVVGLLTPTLSPAPEFCSGQLLLLLLLSAPACSTDPCAVSVAVRLASAPVGAATWPRLVCSPDAIDPFLWAVLNGCSCRSRVALAAASVLCLLRRSSRAELSCTCCTMPVHLRCLAEKGLPGDTGLACYTDV
jgi:hypothetical protein